MKIKPHLALDGYKVDHRPQYPNGTEVVYSNLTARSDTHANLPHSFDKKVVAVGLQGFIAEFLVEAWNEGFFQRPREVVVAEYKRRMDAYLGPGTVNCDHIGELHDLGFLPVEIKAVPEGSRVDIRVPVLTIRNTLPQFFWVTNYLETVLSCETWKMMTVATIAYEYRRILDKYVEATGSDKGFADWQLHDFSMRGLSGYHDAAKVGSAHLMVAGYGTDTLPAIDYLEQYYGANVDNELVGGSVPATEHSVMCMGGMDTEINTYRRLMNEVYPTGIVSIVSDTWDYWNVVTNIIPQLREEILARKPNALGQSKVVIRPDSGDPVKIVAGYKYLTINSEAELYSFETKDMLLDEDIELINFNDKFFHFDIDYSYWLSDSTFDCIRLEEEVPRHVALGTVATLWDTFGGTITYRGYKTLDSHIGVIYGDSITPARAEEILSRLMDAGFSAGNIVFGIGSFTYQYITRDTFGMAVKATYGEVSGIPRELFKDPKTGDGVKKSARGLLQVKEKDGTFVLKDQCNPYEEAIGDLQTVFKDGIVLNTATLAAIRQRLKGA